MWLMSLWNDVTTKAFDRYTANTCICLKETLPYKFWSMDKFIAQSDEPYSKPTKLALINGQKRFHFDKSLPFSQSKHEFGSEKI